MPEVKEIKAYQDGNGNRIVCDAHFKKNILVNFRGKNNTLVVDPTAKIGWLNIQFDCDNGTVNLGGNGGNRAAFAAFVRVGQDSTVTIGQDVTTTKTCIISAVEGTSLEIGSDVMIASDVEIRTDDAHAIFDVASNQRINLSRDVKIGNHVWLANRAVIRGGTNISDGCVVGQGSTVKGEFPNNCIIAGTPAKVVRKNVAWERPHLSLVRPYYKLDGDTVHKSSYWNMTQE